MVSKKQVKVLVKTVVLFVFFVLAGCFFSCDNEKETQIITVEPVIDFEALKNQKDSIDTERTLASVRKVHDIYTMTYYGDYSKLLKVFNNLIKYQYETKAVQSKNGRLNCSLFSYYGDPQNPLFGRNFDNIFNEMFVVYYFPKNGYASISFTPLMVFGFSEKRKFNINSAEHKSIFVRTPSFSIEGINEKGISLALAYISERKFEPDKNKESKFLIHLIKEILDRAGTVDEAVEIYMKYNVYDNGVNIISHNVFIAGPDGKSVVLEFNGERVQVMPNEFQWQVVTNSLVHQVPHNVRSQNCSRYRKAYNKFKNLTGSFSWENGMDLLEKISQKKRRYVIKSRNLIVSTQWSAVFNMKSKEIYLSVFRNYNRIYKFKVRNKEFYLNRDGR